MRGMGYLQKESSNRIEDDSHGDPSTLKSELIFCIKAELSIERWTIVVDNQDSCRLTVLELVLHFESE